MSTTYVAMGDSAGVGFGAPSGTGYVARVFAQMKQIDPEARLVNLSSNGATSQTVRESQVELALRERPTICSIFIGGNDVWRGVEPARFERNLSAIADRVDLLHSRVILGTLPNLSHAPAATMAERFLNITRSQIEARIVEYNDRLRRVAMDHDYALVDLFTVARLDEHPEYFGPDGFHPSADGHEAWFSAMWPAFAAQLNHVARRTDRLHTGGCVLHS